MAKILNSIRIAAGRWESEEAFCELLELLERYKDCIDQVAFFTTYFHSPLPLETARRHCEILRDRVSRVKALGFSCGLNILATVGHHPDRLHEALQGGWQYMTNIDGEECLGSRCMNNRAYFEEYVRPLYALHLAVKPDFIWIDDDVRFGHCPVGICCFCDSCMARFNRDYGYSFDRPALKAAFDGPSRMEVRHAWLCHQSDKITDLLQFIRSVTDECDASVMLGFMSGERYFEGYDFARWAQALSADGRHEIMWRPGGGNYTDRSFEDFVSKSSELGRQAANLPAYVTEVQSEVENFPYRLLRKGPRFTALEALMDITTGCTGTALNILPDTAAGESASVISRHLDEIQRVTPFMRRLSRACGRKPAVGIHSGWHIHSQVAVDNFVGGHGASVSAVWQELYSLGLPEGFAFSEACVFLLSGRAVYAFSDEQLNTILSRGVYLDAGAVAALQDRGFGALTGFSVGERITEDTAEIYADHALNAGFVGKQRYCSPVFSVGDKIGLLCADGAEILCSTQSFSGDTVAACTMGLYRNRLGGIVCASGYYTANELSDTAKSVQMKRLFRLLSGDTLPALVQSYERVRVVARPGQKETAVTLLNTSPDCLTDVHVLLRGEPNRVVVCDEACTQTVLTPQGKDGTMTRFIVPQILPYSIVLLTARENEQK